MFRDDMEVVLANEDAVGAGIRVEPAGKVEGGLYVEELAVVVPDSDRDGRESGGDVEEEEHGDPFVVEVIAEAELAVEVGDIGGAEAGGLGLGREREREGQKPLLNNGGRPPLPSFFKKFDFNFLLFLIFFSFKKLINILLYIKWDT
jgi:hypothetical protein